jgi:hypothetical protein
MTVEGFTQNSRVGVLTNLDGGATMKWNSKQIAGRMTMAAMLAMSAPAFVSAADGTAKGENTDEKGQQGVGLGSSGTQSSNVIMGGPDIVVGKITKIQGEQYSIQGDRGQEVSLRVTKDTNLVCAGGQGTKFSTGQQGAKEQQEIPPTPFMEQQAGKGRAPSEKEMMQQLHQSGTQEEVGALSKDPSQLKDVVGTTDQSAKEDTAKGSGFVVGGQGGCNFKVGDQVRVEASDMGTATTIHQMAQGTGSGSGR